MKYLYFAVLIILVIMSLAAGSAKVANLPPEIQFFENAGIDIIWLLPHGGLQIIGGLMAIYHRTRKVGLVIIALGFVFSTVMIFMAGNAAFGVFSLLPVLLCAFIFWRSNGVSRSL